MRFAYAVARDLADLELLAWDAQVQAARCWEILHVEFPRLRAELGCRHELSPV